MKRIKNFKIKNCEDCFYWQSGERFNQEEFCSFHENEEDQPLGIIEAIQQAKTKQKIQKILYLLLLILLSIPLLLSFMTYGYFSELSNLSTTAVFLFQFCAFFVCFMSTKQIITCFFSFIRIQQEFKEEIKELKQKKREWIIEYE